MLKLGGRVISIKSENDFNNLIFSVTTNKNLPFAIRNKKAFLVLDEEIPDGFQHYLVFESLRLHLQKILPNSNFTVLSRDYIYLGNDDVIRISPHKGSIRVLFRASSNHNSILVTEQCNHYCLMCSQPPKALDDSWILKEIEDLIPLIPRETKEIGFTGGEPTLAGERFLNILKLSKNYLPNTSIHILSNGRSFSDLNFAKKYASIKHNDIMVGIPLYSDDPTIHDYIVQSKGAFDETILGILNLKRLNQKVEIRVVIHKQSINRLVELSEFISRNLLFVDHVALMGLEIMGFTRANLPDLWIDPYEYKDKLSESVTILSKSGLTVSVYNHQLCLVNPDTYEYCRKSISDWKNEYPDECNTCNKKHDCGGFFSSGLQFKYSNHLAPFN